MGRQKRIAKISKRATIKCPKCSQTTRVEVPTDGLLSFWDCPKCKQKVTTPLASFCIVCAFSDKKCTPSVVMEARIKKLELR